MSLQIVKRVGIVLLISGCTIETHRPELSQPEETTVAVPVESPEKAEQKVVEEETLQQTKESPATDTTVAETEKPAETPTPNATPMEKEQLSVACEKGLKFLPGKISDERLTKVCSSVRRLENCSSVEQRPIYHFQKTGQRKGRRILVFGGVHGDERPGASVARQWMARLVDLDPRNTWRILPIVNPDGTIAGTRTNANKVDINRNFPTSDWDKEALKYWKNRVRSKPRKYPGPSAASEPETRCAISHIQTFEPDLIIALHTPLGMLDFDGPAVDFPSYKLPWIRLGHFPGSLGRYMWRDNKVPVLTVELKGNAHTTFEEFDRLQDISGTVALLAQRALKKR